ncbi:hypothetical protein TTHERM_00678080 (macronuclear) [Tetrahymena thermophila SB210]|uniref:Uncharacterized protein n=1 Tax=Tetrahymena thermophila (strain SB210) TaxID=312017 RepID=I7M4K6_TETTS|nr:hypothetical protein TTHERM_00678080 [Tetrahymena thermophila SB210]EAS07542.1 hypothetical protein TTHERM_00678080 [Tetrahymena thermophila SB210]|eukprot:XP_001027784.1 hypothetical protein TTHERM_00678080 [Tetrahymena thermophila SB210]
MNSPNFLGLNAGSNQHQTPSHSDNLGSNNASNSTQVKMKKLWKNLMGHKKAGKLFRLGLQQLTANQPEYFLVVSKKFINQGQHSKAFNLLKKQVYKEGIDIEYKPIIMHHYMHTCYKLMLKLIKKKAKEIQENQEQQEKDPFSIGPSQIPHSHKKKPTLTRLDKLNTIIEIQLENLQIYENLIIDLVYNYESFSQQNDRKYQKLDSNFRSTVYLNNPSANVEPISEMIIQDSKQGAYQSQYNQSLQSKQEQAVGEEAIDTKQTEKVQKKHFDVYKIEAFKENYLLYFLKTILLLYRHYKQEGDMQMALKFIEKGYQFVMSFVDCLFGDFISMEIYRLSGDILQVRANTYFESQNIPEALKLYDKVFNYYRFSGQILLKKFHSKPLEEVDSILELKCEFLFSSLSINTMMQALCYEHLFKFEKMIEALQISDWINMKFLVYEFSDKLRSHVSELLSDAKQKYSTFLEEKGEIRRVLLQAFPDLQQLEKQSVQDNEQNLINKINNYLYEKGNIKNLNQNIFIIHKKQVQNPMIIVQQQEGQQLNSQENFDQINSYMISKDQTLSYNNVSNKNLSQLGIHSPERVKDIGSQSFSDVYNMNSLNLLSNHNNSTTIGMGNSTTNNSSLNNHPSQFSNQTGNFRRTPSAHLQSGYIQNYNSPKQLSSQSLNQNITAGGYLSQNPKVGVSLHQINEIEPLNDYGISSKRPSALQVSNKETPLSNYNNRNSFKISHSQSTKNVNDKEKGFFQSSQSSGMSLQKRYSTGNLVIRSNRPTHEQPAPLYTREHSEQFKPKMLTTNKYFQKETYISKSSKTLSDFKEVTQNCIEQEQKFHYLNLLPIKSKLEKNQGVLSLDYAMENLIKEKIIQYEIKNLQQSLKHQTATSTAFSSNMSNSLQNQINNLQHRYSHHETQQPKSPIYSEIQINTLSPQSNQLVTEVNNQFLNKDSSKKDIFCDRALAKQIRNLMNSLNISSEDQVLIINDLESKFEAEKRSLFSSSKNNQSKVSQQGWTTDKILDELLKSINILGENVNTYNQRFSQFLLTIKDEDFDKSEFYTCLKKLQFRQRMGNGIIPQFFNEREQPLARIQERRKIDDEYVVVQSGGERMVEIMSDHKIIKNLFLDEGNTNEGANANQKPTTKEDKHENSLNNKEQIGTNRHVTYNTAVSILGNQKTSSKVFEPNDEQKNESPSKPIYKQKKKKMQPTKTSTLSDIPLFGSSDSSVEKMMQFGQNKQQKVNYFQKSQEALRQMVLKSEQDYEQMQKEILNPKRNKINSHRNKSLQFANFTNKLAFSTGKYNQKEKIKKAGGKLDLIDFMRIQNKWRQKVQEKHGTVISNGTSEAGSDSPSTNLAHKLQKASRNFILAHAMSGIQSSIFGKANTIEQNREL